MNTESRVQAYLREKLALNIYTYFLKQKNYLISFYCKQIFHTCIYCIVALIGGTIALSRANGPRFEPGRG